MLFSDNREKSTHCSGKKMANGILNQLHINKHKVAGLDHPSAQWTVNNEFDNTTC